MARWRSAGVIFSWAGGVHAVCFRADEYANINASRVAALRDWYQRPLGRLLAETERNALAAQLPTLFGYHLMVIEPPWEDCPLKDSRIPHHFIQSIAPAAQPAPDWPDIPMTGRL